MASFLRVVLAGTVATAVVPWLLVVVLALDGWRSELSVPMAMMLIAVAAFLLAVAGVALLGLPLAIGLRRLRLESGPSYYVGGALAGYLLVWGVVSLLGDVAAATVLAIPGALGGGAAAHVWWTARRGRPDVYVRPFETLRPPRRPIAQATSARYGAAQTWPPRSAPSGDIGVSPLALVMSLVVLGFTVVVASASTGRFDWPPPQQYFPDRLRTLAAIPCDGAESGRIDHFAPLSDLEIDWYSTQLRAAHEPSLYLAAQRPRSDDAQSLRFTWLRSFDAPVVIRVDRLADGEMRLTAKRLSGYGGYDPGRIEAVVERALNPVEATLLEQTLSAGRVVELPPRDCRGGTDGANWIFEANRGGDYSYLMRYMPQEGPVRETGLLLMSFTGWRFDRIY
ncbi:hypothetical protein [Phenylobacterium sp.]|uniref:hypothetical protein n=1 Tax=Phenylobacterium sp. TaxID=1871053 RepID=UPI0035AFE597